MSDTTVPKLDLAQRIAEALTRTTEPELFVPQYDEGSNVSMGGKNIGSVPFHLRHLFNLLSEQAVTLDTAGAAYEIMLDEYEALVEPTEEQVVAIDAAGAAYESQQAEYEALHNLFFKSLYKHIARTDEPVTIKVVSDWQVVAVPSENDGTVLIYIA